MKPKFYQLVEDTEGYQMFYAVFSDGTIFYNQVNDWHPSQMSKDADGVHWFATQPQYNPVAFRDIKSVLTPNHSLKALKQLHDEYVGTHPAIGSAAQV